MPWPSHGHMTMRLHPTIGCYHDRTRQLALPPATTQLVGAGVRESGVVGLGAPTQAAIVVIAASISALQRCIRTPDRPSRNTCGTNPGTPSMPTPRPWKPASNARDLRHAAATRKHHHTRHPRRTRPPGRPPAHTTSSQAGGSSRSCCHSRWLLSDKGDYDKL